MVQAILDMADRTLSRLLREETAEAYCQCPAGTSTYCSGETLVTKFCCSWNCAAKPTCTYTYIYGGC